MATSGRSNAYTTSGNTIIPGNLTSILTGTLTCVAGSKVVTGSGTKFIAELTQYDSAGTNNSNPQNQDVLKYSHIVTDGGEIVELDGVMGDTFLMLKVPNVAGFSGATGYRTAPALKDAQVSGNAVVIKMMNGSFTTPTSAGGPTNLKPNQKGQIPVLFLPTGVSIESSSPIEWLKF